MEPMRVTLPYARKNNPILSDAVMTNPSTRLSLLCLGTGRGATAVYDGETSSSVVLMAGDEPILLVDVGFGVVRACLQAFARIPQTILVTHNHSDHAAELPVILAAEQSRGRKPRVIATPQVGTRLRESRLHELQSTGKPLSAFCAWNDAIPQEPLALTERVTITPVRARHSEPCYGFVLEDNGRPVLAYGGDSACDPDYYDRLWTAPRVILDARSKANAEHAGFDEVAAYMAQHARRDVWITGYGRSDQAPTSLSPLRVGDRVNLATA